MRKVKNTNVLRDGMDWSFNGKGNIRTQKTQCMEVCYFTPPPPCSTLTICWCRQLPPRWRTSSGGWPSASCTTRARWEILTAFLLLLNLPGVPKMHRRLLGMHGSRSPLQVPHVRYRWTYYVKHQRYNYRNAQGALRCIRQLTQRLADSPHIAPTLP